MSWTISSLDIGTVQAEDVDQDTGLMIIKIPGLPSSSGVALGLQGLETSIAISGVNVFTSKTLAQKFLYSGSAGTGTMASPASDSLFGICGSTTNAANLQTSTITYASDFYSSVSGKIKTINAKLENGAAYSIVRYTIEFVVIS